jgi:hypothetical protein
MTSNTGLLESAFAEALENASDTNLTVFGRPPAEGLPDGAPKNDVEALKLCLDGYRSTQAMVDSALRAAAEYLSTPEGLAHFEALKGTTTSGEPSALGRDISERILAAEEFSAFRSQVKKASPAAAGVGIAGNLFRWGGLGLGIEYMFVGDLDVRFWADLELQFGSGVTFGLSVSIWDSTPHNGPIWGVCAEVAYTAANGVPVAARYMLYIRLSGVKLPPEKAGWDLQLGVGKLGLFPGAAGLFIGYQLAKKRSKRLKLHVTNASDDTNTITVDTATSLDVKIIAQADMSFSSGSEMTLTTGGLFTVDEVAAMTISGLPSYLTATKSGKTIVLTASKEFELNAGTTLSFTIGNVQSAGEQDQTKTVSGRFKVSADPTGQPKAVATSKVYLQLQEFSANITKWIATAGTVSGHLTLGGQCANQASCTGGPLTVHSEGGTTAEPILPATADVTQWELGYQFNYYDANTPAIRAVIYNPANPSQFIKYYGTWVLYAPGASGTSIATYGGISGSTTFEVDVTFI